MFARHYDNKRALLEATEAWIRQPAKFYDKSIIKEAWIGEFPFKILAQMMLEVKVPAKDDMIISNIISGTAIYNR